MYVQILHIPDVVVRGSLEGVQYHRCKKLHLWSRAPAVDENRRYPLQDELLLVGVVLAILLYAFLVFVYFDTPLPW